MTWLGLAGFSVSAVQPLVNAMTLHSPWSVTDCWLAPWRQTREIFHGLYFGLWSRRRLLALTLVFYYAVPVLACVVRVRNEAVPNLFGMERLRIAIFRALRSALLLACVWLMFDPEAGPRKIMLHQLKVAWPLLSFDYLLALGAAFLLGSLVYAAQVEPCERPATRFEIIIGFFRRTAWLPLTLFAALLMAGLAARSWRGITEAQTAALSDCGEIIARSLPADGGIVLAQDPVLLLGVQAALSRRETAGRWQCVDLQQLPAVKYRAALERKSPAGWLLGRTPNLDPAALLQMLSQVSARHRIFCLLPEPGNFLFETYYPEPQGAVAELKFLPRNSVVMPTLTPPQIAGNETFWDAAWERRSTFPSPSRTLALSPPEPMSPAEPSRSTPPVTLPAPF